MNTQHTSNAPFGHRTWTPMPYMHMWKIEQIDAHENMVLISEEDSPVLRRFSAPAPIVDAEIPGDQLWLSTDDGVQWAITIYNGARRRVVQS